ncbi:MAG: thiamine pyrophosphate-binding protein [Luminiphilus sp.]
MNSAESLINALAKDGVDACFAIPGTSEMQLVAALDKQPRIRAVLCLFEGVVTGAADGYGRMADKPALTLLHLGPGFANGMANLHNAQRAGSPILTMVGDHATDHLQQDAPLTSDIKGMATPVSRALRVSHSATGLAQTGLDALADNLKNNGSVSTFVVPADHALGGHRRADIARGMGMQALKVETVAQLDQAFADAMENTGPCLIEVML